MKGFLLTLAVSMTVVCAGCAAPPPAGPFDVPVAVVGGEGGMGSMGEKEAVAEIGAARLFFAFDKYDLTPESLRTLTRIAALLQQYPALTLSIDGHCDRRGSVEYNYILGEWRARAAYNALVARGVASSRLRMVSYGKMAPAVPGNSAADMALNRRDNFVVLGACR